MADRDHRIGALEREDVADRQPRDVATAFRRREPSRDVGVESGAIDDLHHLSRLLHGAIPVELGLSLRPGLLGRAPAGERVVGGYEAGDLRGDDQADLATPEIRKRDDGVAPVGLVAEAAGPLTLVDLRGGDSQVAVPLHRVHRQIEVGVNREHGRWSPLHRRWSAPASAPPRCHAGTIQPPRPVDPRPEKLILKPFQIGSRRIRNWMKLPHSCIVWKKVAATKRSHVRPQRHPGLPRFGGWHLFAFWWHLFGRIAAYRDRGYPRLGSSMPK